MALEYPDLEKDTQEILTEYDNLTQEQAEQVAKIETDISNPLSKLVSQNLMWAITGLPNILEIPSQKPSDDLVAEVICKRYSAPGFYAKAEWLTRETTHTNRQERGMVDAVRTYESTFRVTISLES